MLTEESNCSHWAARNKFSARGCLVRSRWPRRCSDAAPSVAPAGNAPHKLRFLGNRTQKPSWSFPGRKYAVDAISSQDVDRLSFTFSSLYLLVTIGSSPCSGSDESV